MPADLGAVVPPLRRVLLADDEEDIRAIVQLGLERIGGFEVRCCASGEEVLAALEGFVPDLLLLDVMMPGTDGLSTLAQVRATAGFELLPVVFITARSDEHELEMLCQLGVADVIRKPFGVKELVEQVKVIWGSMHAQD